MLCAGVIGRTQAQSDWTQFWQKFKTAVVKGDRQTVLALSKSEMLPDGYQQLFGSRAKRNCFAKARSFKEDDGSYTVFCGEQGYLFRKVDGEYRFVEGFAND
jgi:hypothetical protein